MQLGPYEILGELGRGGMGVVHRARRADLQREFALKVIRPGGDTDPESVARFVREARTAASLASHPGIVGVHDIGTADGVTYFAMDLVAGRSLEQLIDQGELEPRRAAALIAQAARALAHAHAHGVLHRDVKPGNLLVTPDDRVLVTDFGLAKQAAAGQEVTRLTRTGHILGTPAYMPPEQAEGQELDARADLYALGATLYEALLGAPPFVGESLHELLLHVLRDEPRPPRKRDPRIPAALDVITLKCLEKRPERRYASAAELAEDLERFLAGEAIIARPPGAMERARRFTVRRKAAVATGAAGVVVAATVGGWFGWRWWEAKAETSRIEAARQAELAARTAAQPHVDRGQDALARMDRLFGRTMWDNDQRDQLAEEGRAAFTEALAVYPGLPEALLGMARIDAMLWLPENAVEWLDRLLAAQPDFAPALVERARITLTLYSIQRTGTQLGQRLPESSELAAARKRAESDLQAAMAGTPPGQVDFVRGLLALARDDVEAAADILTAHARNRVTDGQAWRWAAFTAVSVERWADARTAALQAAEWRPRDAEMLQLLAIAHWKTGHLPEAVDAAGRAFSINPGMSNALVIRSNARRAMGDFAGAVGDLQKLLDSGRGDDSIYVHLARLYLQLGHTRRAHDALDNAAAVAPDRTDALVMRASLFRTERRYAEAYAALDRADQLQPGLGGSYYERGCCLREQGKTAEAVRAFERAVELRPGLWEAWLYLGQDLAGLGRFAAARAALDRAVDLRPTDARSWDARAGLREAQGDLAGALEDYDRGVAQNPDYAGIFTNRAKVRERTGDVAGGLADCARALELEPRSPSAWNCRGLILMNARRYDEALPALDRAIAFGPRHVHAHQNRGLLHLWMGNLDSAEADTRRALEFAPNRVPLYYNLALILQRRKQGPQMLEALNTTLKLAPGHYRARGLRGELLAFNQRPREAATDLRRALQEAPPGWEKREHYAKALAGAQAALKGR